MPCPAKFLRSWIDGPTNHSSHDLHLILNSIIIFNPGLLYPVIGYPRVILI
jgi:hypothetical protein